MRARARGRPLGLAALAALALESAFGVAGEPQPVLSAAVLLCAPGLALLPLLPAGLRAAPVGALAAVPALGFAAAAPALVTVARVGIGLDGTSVRAVLLALVVAGLALPGDEPEWGPRARRHGREALGLGGALLVGLVLQDRVVGGTPVPGNDWAKYALYADEIRRHGALLIENPHWMLGTPFREDPGTPAVYGAFLAMSRAPAAVVAHGIWAFAVALILSTFAYARALWGPVAGVLAAGLAAAMPIGHDILGWHGLANEAALALLPLALLYVTALAAPGADGGLGRTEAAGFALVLVAVGATHRLTALVAALALAAAVGVALVVGERRRVATGVGWTAGWALLLSGGVVSDLVERARDFGGTQPYTAYLSTKVDLSLVARDLSVPVTIAALAAVGLAARRAPREPALVPALCLLAVTAGLAYAWVVHFPVAYFRMAYYLPVALAPLVAWALVQTAQRLGRSAAAAWAGAALVAVTAAIAWPQAENVRRFYAFADAASLRGLDAVAARLRPREVVVTDRCWSFLTSWLLRTRTLPALEPADIQPEAEAAFARQARAILDGTPAGRARARELGVRFLLVDPTCASTRGRPLPPPRVGEPRYLSERLAVLTLPREGR